MSASKLGIGSVRGSDAQLSNIVSPDEKEPVTDIITRYNNNKFIISGYLYKLGRQGKWQKRWFESDGECLCYFKSKERKKLLATLDLLHVGSVAMDDTDPSDCSFIIDVAGRNYHLCANSKDHAIDWVISINRVREARMEIGNLKLIYPLPEHDITPRVVMVAPRKRAKGLGIEDFNEDIKRSMRSISHIDDENVNNITSGTISEASSPGGGTESVDSSNINSEQEASGPVGQPSTRRQRALLRWTKRRPSYQNWMRRLSRWAKRLRSMRFVVRDDFQHLGNSGKRSSESTTKSPLVDTSNLIPQVQNDGESTMWSPSAKGGSEAGLGPASQCPDLDPEVRGSLNFEQIHIAGQNLNQISKGNATRSETPKSQANDEAYTAFEHKTKVPTPKWGMASQSRILREKMEEASSHENSANGDVDSSSGQDSSSTIDEEARASGVV